MKPISRLQSTPIAGKGEAYPDDLSRDELQETGRTSTSQLPLATGITAHLENGGKLEVAQQMATHDSARTAGLYEGAAAHPLSHFLAEGDKHSVCLGLECEMSPATIEQPDEGVKTRLSKPANFTNPIAARSYRL